MLSVKYYFLPEDSFDEQLANNGKSYWLAITDFDDYLRSKIKYDESLTQEQYDVYEEVRAKLHELLGDYDATLDIREYGSYDAGGVL